MIPARSQAHSRHESKLTADLGTGNPLGLEPIPVHDLRYGDTHGPKWVKFPVDRRTLAPISAGFLLLTPEAIKVQRIADNAAASGSPPQFTGHAVARHSGANRSCCLGRLELLLPPVEGVPDYWPDPCPERRKSLLVENDLQPSF